MGSTSRSRRLIEDGASTPRARLLSPFGALIAEIREEAGRAGSLAAAPQAPFRAGRELDLRIETRVVSDPVTARSLSWPWLWPVSLALHAGLLFAAVVGPLFLSERLPAPEHAVRAFFVDPATIASTPALPPPPPVQARTAPHVLASNRALRSTPQRVRPAVPRPNPTAQRVDSTPEAVDPRAVESDGGAASVASLEQIGPEPVDPDAAGGEPPGVPGGSAGGTTGDMIRRLPTPPARIEPIRVGGEITEPKKLKHVNPVYPDIAVRANIHGTVVLECTVNPQGRVLTVKIVRGIPMLNAAAVAAVTQWVYTPTLRDGEPVPVILTVTVQFGLEERRRSTLGQPVSVWAAIRHLDSLL
jgi:protein TonB